MVAASARTTVPDAPSTVTSYPVVINSIIRTPPRAPRATATAERSIGTLRRERLDHLLITGPHHLKPVLQEHVEHYKRTVASIARSAPTGRWPPAARYATTPSAEPSTSPRSVPRPVP